MMSDEQDYAADVEIDAQALDKEWLRQAALYGRYARLGVIAEDKLARAKETLNVTDSHIELAIRKDPAAYGLDKISEASIKAAVLVQAKHAAAQEAVFAAQRAVNATDSACKQFDHKKRALENLVTLHGQHYFAGPSVPLDIGREWAEGAARTGAADKIKARLGSKTRMTGKG